MRRVWIAALLSGCATSDGSGPATRPNVLFILCDDLRWDCIGLHPGSPVRTPNIDRIGREGVHFHNAFCTTSLCSPSRASILSGLYAHAHGVSNNFTEFPEGMPTWPRALHEAGYETAYIGKYHMGEENDARRPGFDRFVTHRGQGKYFDTEFCFDGGERRVVPGYYTTAVTGMAEAWIRERSGHRPWALMLGHKAPHSFYVPEPKHERAFEGVPVAIPPSADRLDDNDAWYRDRLETWHGIYGPLFDFRKKWPGRDPESFAAMTRAYWGTILSVDESVGRLLKLLEERGELDRTLVIFTGDNGLLNGEHGMVDKRTMHEPSIRVPLVARYPKWGPPRAVEAMVLTVDFAPTILEACGLRPPAKTHGRSWRRLAAEGTDPGRRASFLYHYNYEKQFPYTPNVRGVRTERWKYVRYPHGDGGPDRRKADLFDLATDPGEARNLIDDPGSTAVVRELQAELERLLRETGAVPDRMPLDEGVKKGLPDPAFR